jgi:solute carrier family 25 (mitochondrial oxoglutarate transporter), member 11
MNVSMSAVIPVVPAAPSIPAAAPAPKKIDGRPNFVKVIQPFACGGFAGAFATCVIQPIDMVKVRIQIAGEAAGASKNPFLIFGSIVKNDGVSALYKGLDAAILRQLTYTTTRLGVFRYSTEYLKSTSPAGEPIPLWKKAGAGLFAGAVGAFVGNPADLSLIRMQADSTLPLDQRRNYKGVFDAFTTIVKTEGITGLWKGSLPTITRAMALNMGMLASFEQAKETFNAKIGPGWTASLAASAISGFAAASFSLPFDFVKTRIQKQKPINGVLPYKGSLDCAIKVAKAEGPMAFYAGFPTYYFRIAPHAMIVLLMVDLCEAKIKTAFEKNQE